MTAESRPVCEILDIRTRIECINVLLEKPKNYNELTVLQKKDRQKFVEKKGFGSDVVCSALYRQCTDTMASLKSNSTASGLAGLIEISERYKALPRVLKEQLADYNAVQEQERIKREAVTKQVMEGLKNFQIP